MKKSEFRSKLKMKNDSAKSFFKYNTIALIIFSFIVIAMLFVHISNFLPFSTCLIIDVLLLVFVALPLIVLNIKNDIEVNELYKNYKNGKDFSKYKDKSKFFKWVIVVEAILSVIFGFLVVWNLLDNNEEEVLDVSQDRMTIVTNLGNTIEMKYVDVGELSIKIPNDFEIMDEEVAKIKYPSENRPPLIYTNEDASINVAFNLKIAIIAGSSVAEYVNIMKDLLVKMGYDVNIGSFEIDGKKLYTLRFVSRALDTDIYNNMILFEDDGILKTISLNCIEKYMDEWKDVFSFITHSIKFK